MTLEEQIQKLTAELDAANAKCAEMKDVILKCLCRDGVPVIGDPEEAWINHSISCDCGKGYVKAGSLRCFKCDDGHTPLYCLNCAREGYHHDDEWRPVVEALKDVEWGHTDMAGWPRCPSCGLKELDGIHHKDCQLKQALAHAEKLMSK